MQTEPLPRAAMYAPHDSARLFADCPHCDYPFPLGVSALAAVTDVWCSKCQRPFAIEPPQPEETAHGAERARAY